jgi:hypothetical protein
MTLLTEVIANGVTLPHPGLTTVVWVGLVNW